ncbi:LacI family DNA-binding transcriptional regulator [Ancrocorticia populi]|uniref:LacI family transcriptional regulator n=1 Tax=Ancrocorticia populi TaxID=2175228 RepID=A0A2V1KA85_9ACTO|nr:LacI family DNA-binding transcriptional regulator [Ancrocorticia populi]PWF26567.1 LacI family transcriptional regulator [Ancrocorticia populi]
MANQQGRATTRADVARLAGVSTAVVSYVVNDGPRGVSDATRDKVLRAIQQLNYRPNASARALKTGSTKSLGVVVSDITNPHYAEFVEAIDAAANEDGLSLMLGISHGDSEGEEALIQNLIKRGVDGLLLINCRLTDDRLRSLGATDKPCVLLDRSLSGSMLSTVNADLRAGARMAVEHLADHGHRAIAYISGPLSGMQTDHRADAYEAVLRERGLPQFERKTAAWTRDGGYEAANDLLSLPEPPTAIFAASDLMAIGVLNAAQERGVRVPDDLAIVGLDGTAESKYVSPALTTVRQPLQLMAKTAVDLLASAEGQPHQTIFPVELVVRGSCGAHDGATTA